MKGNQGQYRLPPYRTKNIARDIIVVLQADIKCINIMGRKLNYEHNIRLIGSYIGLYCNIVRSLKKIQDD